MHQPALGGAIGPSTLRFRRLEQLTRVDDRRQLVRPSRKGSYPHCGGAYCNTAHHSSNQKRIASGARVRWLQQRGFAGNLLEAGLSPISAGAAVRPRHPESEVRRHRTEGDSRRARHRAIAPGHFACPPRSSSSPGQRSRSATARPAALGGDRRARLLGALAGALVFSKQAPDLPWGMGAVFGASAPCPRRWSGITREVYTQAAGGPLMSSPRSAPTSTRVADPRAGRPRVRGSAGALTPLHAHQLEPGRA
jgi:hypothetical protein